MDKPSDPGATVHVSLATDEMRADGPVVAVRRIRSDAGPERVEVLFAAADGTHKVHRYTSVRAAAQLWDGGRAIVILRDQDGGQTGSAQYAHAVCIRRGAACDSEDAL